MKEIKIINNSNNPLPKYATAGSAGMDLYANLIAPVVIKPGARELIPTGLHISLPANLEAQIRPRSGLAFKQGLTVLNAPGTIDSDYRGDVGVILINLGSEDVTINSGDRIAQMIISKYEQITWEEVDSLDDTERGSGGYGHTGI